MRTRTKFIYRYWLFGATSLFVFGAIRGWNDAELPVEVILSLPLALIGVIWKAIERPEEYDVSDLLSEISSSRADQPADPAINPATGLPMVGAVDVEGNPYGAGSLWKR